MDIAKSALLFSLAVKFSPRFSGSLLWGHWRIWIQPLFVSYGNLSSAAGIELYILATRHCTLVHLKRLCLFICRHLTLWNFLQLFLGYVWSLLVFSFPILFVLHVCIPSNIWFCCSCVLSCQMFHASGRATGEAMSNYYYYCRWFHNLKTAVSILCHWKTALWFVLLITKHSFLLILPYLVAITTTSWGVFSSTPLIGANQAGS